MNKKSVRATHITNVFFYTAMPLIRSALNFLSLPILTRYLSPDKYGIISLITMIATFGWMFCLGINNASYRLFFKYKDDIGKLRSLLSTNLLFTISALFLYSLVIVFLFPFFNNYFFKNQLRIIWIILALIQFSLIYINTVNQDILKIKFEGKKWFFNELISTVIMVALTIILAVNKKMTFEAIIIGSLTAEIVKFCLVSAQLHAYYSIVFKPSILKESLGYSWLQSPAAIISFTYSYFDKILLSRLRGLTQVGILDMSNRISLILKANMDGISGVFSPVSLELLTENTKESLKKLADICLQVVFFTLLLSVGIILFSKEIILLLTAKEYHFAIYIAPIYIYYQVFGVLGMIAYWLIYFHAQNTFWQIPINIIGLVSNTIANIILIPRYGLIGAAIAVFLSTGLTQVIQFAVGIRIIPIPINKFKLASMFFMLFAETSGLYLLYYLSPGHIIEIFIKIIMFLGFAGFGLATGLFNFVQIKEVSAIFKDKVKFALLRNKNIANQTEVF